MTSSTSSTSAAASSTSALSLMVLHAGPLSGCYAPGFDDLPGDRARAKTCMASSNALWTLAGTLEIVVLGDSRTATVVHSVGEAMASTTWARLPGSELVRRGLRDLSRGDRTTQGLLVAVGAPRLRALGIEVPEHTIEDPEHRLYALLAEKDAPSAHSRYNALVRRLVSFERSVERSVGRRLAKTLTSTDASPTTRRST